MKKYEQLINHVINEDEAQARELFHEIVVEKSREIFESIMAEEMDDDDDEEGLEEGEMVGEVGDLLDEIDAEESGMTEEEDIDFDDDTIDLDGDEEGEEDHEEIEDAVIRIEDKLDQLMAEFEEIMGNEAGGEDFGDEENVEDFDMDDEEGAEDFGDEDFGDEEDSEDVMEAVQLQKVSVTHGDNGSNTKSPTLHDPKVKAAGVNPVRFSDGDEKGRSAPTTKDLPGAGKFKNAPGHKGLDLDSAPKPKHGDDGSNNKSPVAESRRSARRPIR